MPTPHALSLLVTKKIKGIDPLVDAVLTPLASGEESISARNFELAKVIFESPIKKNYVDAALFASENLQEIADVLEIPKNIIETYQLFFFDIRGFNKLSKLELLESYDEQGKDLLIWAMSSGLDFLRWRLGETVNINPIEGLKTLFSMSMYKAQEAMYASNSSANSIEAQKWSKAAADLARLLKMYLLDTGAAKKDIELALGTLTPEFTSFAGLDGLKD